MEVKKRCRLDPIQHMNRPIKIIKEQISDVNELIKINKDLLDQYPEDFSLKINLESLEGQLNQLLSEFESSSESFMIGTYDIAKKLVDHE